MNWFIIALVTPITHALANHIDKHLISKYFRGGQVGSLVLFSALFAIFCLPIIAIIDPTVLSISLLDALLLMVNGLLLVLAYICYFYALERDEASIVIPLFQLIPIFGFGLAYFFLGETLSFAQIISALIIIIGAIVLSLEFSGGKTRIKRTLVLLMLGSSFLYAANGVLFKFVAEDLQRFWPSLFWDFTGKVIVGFIILLTVKSYRQQFLIVLKQNRASILAINSFNETLTIIGEGTAVFAVLLAPVALVQVVYGFQPFFVFIIGVFLTLFIPSLGKESLKRQDLVQKIVGIIITVAGSVFLSQVS